MLLDLKPVVARLEAFLEVEAECLARRIAP
jgi:hypothetical protein